MSEAALHFDYSQAKYSIRQDLPQAYREVWDKIASPGNWFPGQDRVSIAAEVRSAWQCDLCLERKSALSPFSVTGNHRSVTNLPDTVIDAVHRLTTDASRLTKSWLGECQRKGLSLEQYVELLGVVVAVVSIDGFHRALGIELEPLPTPNPGEPDQYCPDTAVDGDAWVPMIPPASANGQESDLYDGSKQTGNVISAMSLVPDSVRLLKTLSAVQYLKLSDVPNPSKNANRKISRAQMELLAGRVSALSDCFY
ncbi:MAG TPA: hypothetical protein EYQ14_08815 [Gammaproteobacteria bacterium]|nr:hypothetical protein [Gammaproteobacteria bacterium]